MELIRHPATPSSAVKTVTVDCERAGGRLHLQYHVSDPAALRLKDNPAKRTDELWRHTCFEAFVAGYDTGYREFNFAPSGAWAAYTFDEYRTGMRDAAVDPHIIWNGSFLTATAAIDIPGDWRLNLTAVIEETDGTKSYWALAHPDGPPDFHDPACFVLTLPAPR